MGSAYTKRYTNEFKRDAIALVGSSGKTVTTVARGLGMKSRGSHPPSSPRTPCKRKPNSPLNRIHPSGH
ncbi:transposase [Streptomyces sp. NPDC017890]|uniref:transposase n=1 Tax=Streptomyces sp. NPDC017890 TaxID=3365015 RepID=UPI0037B5AC46